jgi:class 3 adenylate cyclase
MKKESELRQATILFADISGFTAMSEKMSPEEVTSVMNSVFKMMGDIIEHYGGRIDKFIGDCVMATFGVPTAIENAPNKAVNTAIEMRNKLYIFNKDENLKIPLDIHIGINSGNVLAGEVGSDQKKEYTVMGDTVNLASRLEDASQTGQILVGSATHQSTKDEFEFKELKPIKLKGKEHPVLVFELVSEKEKIHRRLTTDRMIQSEMVGREKEIDLLALHVLKAKNGEGSIVNVIGEAGIGKSRLIAELKKRDAIKQATIFEGRALSIGRNLNFYPIIQIIKNWVGISEEDTDHQVVTILEHAIQELHPEQADEIFPFIALMMGLKLSGKAAERIKNIEGDATEKLVLKNLRSLLIKSAEVSPLVIFIEDLHWIDSSSLEMLEAMFNLVLDYRILFVNVFRPHYKETGDHLLEFVEEQYSQLHVNIYLQNLSTDQSEELIDNLLKIEMLPADIKGLIKTRAEGNPFFIEEVIRSFIDEGAIEFRDGRFCITKKLDAMTIPNTIQELLLSRIDKLDEETRSLLKTASVIGRNFFHKIITDVVEHTDDIDAKISYLKEVQLIRQGKRMDEIEYLFKHALAQEATYESILVQKRKELHRKVAESIERVFLERLHEFFGMLAYHFSQGDNLEKAEEYMIKAADEALKSSASSEAINYYKHVLDLYSRQYGDKVDSSKIALLEKNIALALLYRGNYVESVVYYDRAMDKLGFNRQQKMLLLVPGLIWKSLSLLHYFFFPPQNTVTPTEKDIQYVNLVLNRNKALLTIDTKRAMIEVLNLTSHLKKLDISKSVVLFDTYIGFSFMFYWGGISFKIGRKGLKHAQHLFETSTIVKESFLYRVVIATVNCFTGNWENEYDSELIDSTLKVGDTMMAAGYQLLTGLMLIGLGEFETINKLQQDQFRIATDFNDDHARSDFFEIRSSVFLLKFELDKALKDIDDNIRLMDKVKQYERKITFLGMKIQVEALQGRFADAENTLADTKLLIQQLETLNIIPLYYSRFVIGRSHFYLAKMEHAIKSNDLSSITQFKKSAINAVTDAVKTSKKFAPISTEANRLTGKIYWLINKQKKALKWFDKSIKEGGRLGARPDLSRTYMEIGKRLLEPKSKYKHLNGITGEEYLEKAQVMFEEMDLKWDLEQLEKVKRGEEVPIV